MFSKVIKKGLLAAVVCVLGLRADAQGTFQNLDFEDATIAPTPVGGSLYPANAAQAFPGWTVGGSRTVVAYNDYSLGSPAVDLMGPNFPSFVNYAPLQGSYSVLMQYWGPIFDGFVPPTLSQTGLVPANVESINFLVSPSENNGVVEINGVAVPLYPVAGGRLAGNVSAWSGETVQLTFTTASMFYFDDVNFSTTAVPEPDSLLLFCIPIFAVALKRRSSRLTIDSL